MEQKTRLKIAQVAPLVESVPPRMYGGTERVIEGLSKHLALNGHDVTLIATADSFVEGVKTVPVCEKGLRGRVDDPYNPSDRHNIAQQRMVERKQREFDIIHYHTNLNTYSPSPRVPSLYTLHNPIDQNFVSTYERYGANVAVATLSQAHGRQYLPWLNWQGFVYNGLDMETYPFSPEGEDFLLFVGRISAAKGVDLAIKASQKAGLPLIIAAKLDPHIKEDQDYYESEIKPHLSGSIEWIGEVNQDQRNELMSRCKAFLHPARFEEPFGLTLIEAGACGAPVIALRRGSIPEIIRSGQTGVIVDGADGQNIADQLGQAIGKISKIKREECRSHILANFNASVMTGSYERIYHRLKDNAGKLLH